MPQPDLPRHILIDFENVPAVDLAPLAGMVTGVTLFVGAKQKALGVDLVAQMLECSSHVQLVRLGASGRNALDLILAFYLGKAVAENPRAEFFIISGDKDYDAVIKQVAKHGVRVSRYVSVAELPFVEKSAVLPKPIPSENELLPSEERLQSYAQKLRKGPAPRDLNALRKKILNDLKKHIDPEDVDEVIAWQKKERVVEVNADGKVKILSV
jgi:hypothetical protein